MRIGVTWLVFVGDERGWDSTRGQAVIQADDDYATTVENVALVPGQIGLGIAIGGPSEWAEKVAGTFYVPSAGDGLDYGTWNVPATFADSVLHFRSYHCRRGTS